MAYIKKDEQEKFIAKTILSCFAWFIIITLIRYFVLGYTF